MSECKHIHEGGAENLKTLTYSVTGLDCAVCAGKVEERIRKMEDVEDASLNFAAGSLSVKTLSEEDLTQKIQQEIDKVEKGVTITEKAGDVRTYTLEGLDCAVCGAKIEEKVSNLENVDRAVLVFATKQIKVYGSRQDLTQQIQKAADSVEDGITVISGKGGSLKMEDNKEEKIEIISIIAGAVLMAAGIIAERMQAPLPVTLAVYIVAYIILGWNVLITAGKNIIKGQMFDENFLMSIATLGAFGIQEYPEAVGVMLFYKIGEYFEDRAVEKSRMQIMDAVDMRPETVNLAEGDDIIVTAAQDIQPGQIILVRTGDRIPLDGIVVSGESRIDTSPVTGEYVPVLASEGDEVISGCVNTSAQIMVKVTKPLSQSMVTRILESVENAAANKPKIDRFITRFSKVYTPVVVAIALMVAFLMPFVSDQWHMFIDPAYTGLQTPVHGSTGTASVFTALTFLVISCPCALVLSVPLAFFAGIGAGSKKGILFKGGTSIEALAAVSTVIMDKTGTVTEGTFEVEKIVPVSENIDERKLLEIAACAEYQTTHPIGRSITDRARAEGIEIKRPSRVSEKAGYGIVAVTEYGSVLCGNLKLMEASGAEVKNYNRAEGTTEVLIAVNGRFAGYIVISDVVKKGAKEAVAKIKKAGIRTVMLTGDSAETAEAVCRETGIDEVYAKLLPEDKLKKLEEIRGKKNRVMFVGDGINDAPVLAGADVGAAMGSGADAAIEAADVVFMTSEITAVPDAVGLAKRTRNIAWQNVVFALVVKAAIMAVGLAGFANMWLAVFADTGVALICLLNSIRMLK